MAEAGVKALGYRSTPGERVAAGVFAALSLALLLVAATLRPQASGSGTHTQLGLAPCGWVVKYGRPCMTCGMTTAFAHAAEGELSKSFVAQPGGLVLAVGAAATFWAGLHVAATGSRLGHMFARLLTPRWIAVGAVVFLAAWVYKLVTFTNPLAPVH